MPIPRVQSWLMLRGAFAVGLPALSAFAAENNPVAATVNSSAQALDWNTGANRSYVIPAIEVPGFLVALNAFNRTFLDHATYGVTTRSIYHNLKHGPWDIDDDPFNVNQFGHPSEGAIMFGAARSSGVGFWGSLIYSNAGSLLWELAGETGHPSGNDIITTAQAGSLLGESLFRMANLLLEHGGKRPGSAREFGAAALMPSLGFNRLVYGERFRTIYPSRNPEYFWQLKFGGSADERARDNKSVQTVKRQEFMLDFSMEYGLPGRSDYAYERPFDYFQFEFAALTSAHTHNWVENVFCRGLLWGKDYMPNDRLAGVFGLYGSYDFSSPQVFRVSNTAVSLGTTAQWWLARDVALQGTTLAGVGFGGAGTNPVKGTRDYHYGVTPQGLGALRFLFGERAMLDFTGRLYYISGTGSDDQLGTETIARGTIALTVRTYGANALGLQYTASHRLSHYIGLPSTHQSVGTFTVTYTYLSHGRFGAVGPSPR